MEILKIKKISKSKYKLYLEEKEIELFEYVLIKYNLLCKKNINLDLLNEILEFNLFYEAYDIALKYISIKLRNKKELINYLESKMFDSSVINKIIKKLESENYLNEKKYIEAYVNDKINFTNYGPYKIKKNLLKYGIDESLMDDYINSIEKNVWSGKIKNIIDKKVKSNKTLSKFYFIRKLSLDLYNLGYEKNLIDEYLEYIDIDEKPLIKKEYEKAYKKFKNKENLLNQHIRNYLITKGFDFNNINEIINE